MSLYNWPKQDKALYRYRLEPDGSVTCQKITNYSILRGRHNRPEYRFPQGSICSVKEEDLGRVKNNHVTMFDNDMEKARTLFKEFLQVKADVAEKTLAECRQRMEAMKTYEEGGAE